MAIPSGTRAESPFLEAAFRPASSSTEPQAAEKKSRIQKSLVKVLDMVIFLKNAVQSKN
jgi:hypothetical protein